MIAKKPIDPNYPTFMTHINGARKIVNSKAELETAGSGWYKERADAEKEAERLKNKKANQ